MFIDALFTIAKIWKQCKCPSMEEWMKKMWLSIYVSITYLVSDLFIIYLLYVYISIWPIICLRYISKSFIYLDLYLRASQVT